MFQPYRFCNASYHTIPVRQEHGAPVRANEFNITQQSVACLLGAGPPAGSYSSRKNKLAGTEPKPPTRMCSARVLIVIPY